MPRRPVPYTLPPTWRADLEAAARARGRQEGAEIAVLYTALQRETGWSYPAVQIAVFQAGGRVRKEQWRPEGRPCLVVRLPADSKL